jgi:hypothetical protein
MLTLMLDIDTASLERDTNALLDRLSDASARAFDRVAVVTAEQAQRSHWYRNRSGDLQASTRAVDYAGELFSDTLESAVVASEPYASYVDARSPILAPAWDEAEPAATADLLTILEQACNP